MLTRIRRAGVQGVEQVFRPGFDLFNFSEPAVRRILETMARGSLAWPQWLREYCRNNHVDPGDLAQGAMPFAQLVRTIRENPLGVSLQDASECSGFHALPSQVKTAYLAFFGHYMIGGLWTASRHDAGLSDGEESPATDPAKAVKAAASAARELQS